MSNPHRHARRLIRAHQREERGPVATAASVLVPLVAAALVTPLFRPVFLHFLGQDPTGEGLFGLLVRAVLLVVGLASIDTYGVLIRSESRRVLGILPVDPGEVAIEELRDLIRRRAWVCVAAAILIVPLGPALGWLTWAASAACIAAAWLAGITVSGAVHLQAISAAEDERLAGLLDLLRGSNPREQAAFLWAPGVALALASIPGAVAAEGVRRVALGEPTYAAGVIAPLLVAGLAATRITTLARAGWFRASAVLADIDARYAMVEEVEEATSAYLDWLPRFLPAPLARFALKDLRHGWRGRRSWISAMWGVGVIAGLAAWGGDSAAPGRGLALGLIGIWLTAVVGVLLERDEPDFLRAWLPQHPLQQGLARGVVLLAWLQPAVWLPALVIAIRHGVGEAVPALALAEGAVIGSSLLAVACARLRESGVLVYGPTAAVAGGALALLATGGLS